MCIIVGLIICIKYQSIIAILLFIFGVFITISGAVDLITSFYSKSSGIVSWGVSTFLSIAVLILGVVIMINPFSTSVALVRLVGAGLVGYAIVDLVTFIQIKKQQKRYKKSLKISNRLSSIPMHMRLMITEKLIRMQERYKMYSIGQVIQIFDLPIKH